MNCEDKNTCGEKNVLFLNNSITEHSKCVTCSGQYIRPLTFHSSAPVTRNPKHWSHNHQSVLRFDLVATNVFNLEKRKKKTSLKLNTRLLFFCFFCVLNISWTGTILRLSEFLGAGGGIKNSTQRRPRRAGKAFGRLGSYGGGRVNAPSLSAAVPSVATWTLSPGDAETESAQLITANESLFEREGRGVH